MDNLEEDGIGTLLIPSMGDSSLNSSHSSKIKSGILDQLNSNAYHVINGSFRSSQSSSSLSGIMEEEDINLGGEGISGEEDDNGSSLFSIDVNESEKEDKNQGSEQSESSSDSSSSDSSESDSSSSSSESEEEDESSGNLTVEHNITNESGLSSGTSAAKEGSLRASQSTSIVPLGPAEKKDSPRSQKTDGTTIDHSIVPPTPTPTPLKKGLTLKLNLKTNPNLSSPPPVISPKPSPSALKEKTSLKRSRSEPTNKISRPLRISISSPIRIVNFTNPPLSDDEEEEDPMDDDDHEEPEENAEKAKKTGKNSNFSRKGLASSSSALISAPTSPVEDKEKLGSKKMGTFDAKGQAHYIPPPCMLTCSKCKKEQEVSYSDYGTLPSPFDKKYKFQCPGCTGGSGKLEHEPKSWTEIALTAAYNLQVVHEKEYFHSKLDICVYVDKNWEKMCSGKTRTNTWWATLHAQITQNKHLFKTASFGSGYWGICYENHKPQGSSNKGRKKEKKERKAPKTAQSTPAVFRVEKILGKRVRNGQTEYYLKWMDFPVEENTWENEENIYSKEMITQFEKLLVDRGLSLTDKNGEITIPYEADTNSIEVERRERKRARVRNLGTEGEEEGDGANSDERVPVDKCHQCHARKTNLVSCGSQSLTACKRFYCADCLVRIYKTTPETIEKCGNAWECPFCSGTCKCNSCRRMRKSDSGEITLSPDISNRMRTSRKKGSRGIFDLGDPAPTVSSKGPVFCPNFREIPEDDTKETEKKIKGEIADSLKEESSDEDTSDEFYEEKHKQVMEYEKRIKFGIKLEDPHNSKSKKQKSGSSKEGK